MPVYAQCYTFSCKDYMHVYIISLLILLFTLWLWSFLFSLSPVNLTFISFFFGFFCSQWVVTNLQQSSRSASSASSFSWVFDLDGIAQMYQSYEGTNLWYAALKLLWMIVSLMSFLFEVILVVSFFYVVYYCKNSIK